MLFQLIGRLHPLLVHLPIGILLLAFLLELLSLFGGLKKLKAAVQPVLLIGALTSLFSVLSGLILAEEGGYDDDLLAVHKYLGITTSVVSFLVYFIRKRNFTVDKVKRKRIRFMFLIPVVLFVSLTGHFGGSITHGEDYLTGFLNILSEEQSDQVNFDSLTNIDEAVMYADIIQPILEAKCYSCHSSKKQKGQLRLDGIAFIKRGGKNGDVLVSDIPDSSALYHRLLLPVEDKKHMPPEEKSQLSSAEIDLIHSWVSGGYSFDKKVSLFKESEKIKGFVAAIQAMRQQKKSWVPDEEVSAASEKTLQQLKALGVLIMPVAQGSNYLMVNFVNARTAGNKELELLLPLKDQLLWLNLEKTQVTNEGMATLEKLEDLRVLYLNNTALGDTGIERVSKLPELVYLNLVGTKITDAALVSLADCKKLEGLYVYQTNVTSSAVRDFVSTHQEISVDTGRYKLPFLPSDTVVYKKSL